VGEPPVVAFLSSGRCGTRWIASGLRELYPGLDVEHHAIGPLYKPRRYFRRYEDPEAILEVPEVARHVERIERSDHPYVETGWPLFAALPLLADRLEDRLRIVHLTRHPVPTALSHLAHQFYAGSRRDDGYTRFATLGARDPGVSQSFYASSWDQLSPYERCLFWWTEVHLFGIEFPGRDADVPFMRIKSEEIMSGSREAIERLLEFMDLPWDPAWLSRDRVIDRWHQHADRYVDPLQVHRHPTTADVARELGYDISHLNAGELEARYRGQPDADRGRIGRRG
jgi:hypothetical protein